MSASCVDWIDCYILLVLIIVNNLSYSLSQPFDRLSSRFASIQYRDATGKSVVAAASK